MVFCLIVKKACIFTLYLEGKKAGGQNDRETCRGPARGPTPVHAVSRALGVSSGERGAQGFPLS